MHFCFVLYGNLFDATHLQGITMLSKSNDKQQQINTTNCKLMQLLGRLSRTLYKGNHLNKTRDPTRRLRQTDTRSEPIKFYRLH